MDNGINYDRFTMKQGDVTFYDENGILIDPHNNDKKRFDDITTYSEALQVGDIVSLKNREGHIRIEYVDFTLNGQVLSKYAGSICNSENQSLLLFNQEDILNKLSEREKNSKIV